MTMNNKLKRRYNHSSDSFEVLTLGVIVTNKLKPANFTSFLGNYSQLDGLHVLYVKTIRAFFVVVIFVLCIEIFTHAIYLANNVWSLW